MTPIQFPESNFTYRKPESMTDEQCSDLPCWVGSDANGMQSVISKWKLSPEEIEKVKETGEIYLSVMTPQMPPVVLFVEYPFIPLEEINSEKESNLQASADL